MKHITMLVVGILTAVPTGFLALLGIEDGDAGEAMPTGDLFKALSALWLASGVLVEILIAWWWP